MKIIKRISITSDLFEFDEKKIEHEFKKEVNEKYNKSVAKLEIKYTATHILLIGFLIGQINQQFDSF